MAKSIFHKSESHFAKQFKATLVSDKASQFKDIDAKKNVLLTDPDTGIQDLVTRTYSIKYQSRAAASGCFSFETKLIDTQTGQEIAGNFIKCKADYMVITDGEHWHFYDAPKLKEWLRENHSNYPAKTLTYYSVQLNREQGRKYDDASSYIVPKEDIEQFLLSKVVHRKRITKDYNIKKDIIQ